MAQMSPNCSLCGARCDSMFYVSGKGEPLCATHQSAPRCHMCQSVRDIVVGPSIAVCLTCDQVGVINNAQALNSANPVLAWFARELGPSRLGEIPIEVGSLPTNANSPSGNLGHTLLTQTGDQAWAEITLAAHQHPSMLSSTLAHEYGHVLLTLNPRDLSFHGNFARDPYVEEGSCEVIRALWLEHSATVDAAYLRKLMNANLTPVYGDGFRMMWKEYEKIGSLQGFLDFVVFGSQTFVPIQPTVSTPTVDPVVYPTPLDLHRPTIRVVPPTIGPTSIGKTVPTPSSARPIIRVEPVTKDAKKSGQPKTNTSERPRIKFNPPN